MLSKQLSFQSKHYQHSDPASERNHETACISVEDLNPLPRARLYQEPIQPDVVSGSNQNPSTKLSLHNHFTRFSHISDSCRIVRRKRAEQNHTASFLSESTNICPLKPGFAHFFYTASESLFLLSAETATHLSRGYKYTSLCVNTYNVSFYIHFPMPESVQDHSDWAAWSVKGVPAHDRGAGTGWSLRSLATQTILWFSVRIDIAYIILYRSPASPGSAGVQRSLK